MAKHRPKNAPLHYLLSAIVTVTLTMTLYGTACVTYGLLRHVFSSETAVWVGIGGGSRSLPSAFKDTIGLTLSLVVGGKYVPAVDLSEPGDIAVAGALLLALIDIGWTPGTLPTLPLLEALAFAIAAATGVQMLTGRDPASSQLYWRRRPIPEVEGTARDAAVEMTSVLAVIAGVPVALDIGLAWAGVYRTPMTEGPILAGQDLVIGMVLVVSLLGLQVITLIVESQLHGAERLTYAVARTIPPAVALGVIVGVLIKTDLDPGHALATTAIVAALLGPSAVVLRSWRSDQCRGLLARRIARRVILFRAGTRLVAG